MPKDPFDAFDEWFGNRQGAQLSDLEKGVAWHAKQIDNKLYLPADEVLELLKSNDVLPKMQEALKRHLA